MIAPRRGRGVPARALNRLVILIVGRLGVPVPRVRLLRVHGRRTGRLRLTPVMVLRQGGRRYLVAPRGETDWVRNLRSAGWGELVRGSTAERVRAAEVTGEERAVVVSAYARRFGWLNGRFFALPRGFRLEDARRVAARHPTFRLTTTLVVVVVVALGLVAPAWAAAARTGYVIGPRALPPDVPTARADSGAPSTGRPRARSPAPTSTTCSASVAASCAPDSPTAGAGRSPAPCASTPGGTRTTPPQPIA